MNGHVMYSGDGKGNWWRTQWAKQCSEKTCMLHECQGAKGHQGEHWAFSPSGDYAWSVNLEENPPLKPADIACGFTPPGHKEYRSPETMREFYYLSQKTASKVEDPQVIASLENDLTPEEDASINRPVRLDKHETR